MSVLVRAALGTYQGPLLLVNPSPRLLGHLVRSRPERGCDGREGSVVALFSGWRLARRSQILLAANGGEGQAAVHLVVAGGAWDRVPLGGTLFGALVFSGGIGEPKDTVSFLRHLGAYVRPGGPFVWVSPLREGPWVLLSAWQGRRGGPGRYPAAEELTRWMLEAGMRRVRQARLRSVVPTAVTWAEVRSRPWDSPTSVRGSLSDSPSRRTEPLN